jgi:hypothetical protein
VKFCTSPIAANDPVANKKSIASDAPVVLNVFRPISITPNAVPKYKHRQFSYLPVFDYTVLALYVNKLTLSLWPCRWVFRAEEHFPSIVSAGLRGLQPTFPGMKKGG